MKKEGKDAKETKEAKEAPKEAKKAPPQKKPHPAAAKPARVESENFRGIVRIAGKDMKGELPLRRALLRVRGIGQTMAVAASDVLRRELSIDPSFRVGELTDEQIEKIDAVLASLGEYKVPAFLLNRRNDNTTGKDKHDIMNDLIFDVQQDVERDKKLYTWKGYRHFYGQKVRGQRTRNTGRTGMAVGVLRKAIIAAAGGAAKAPAATGAAPAGAAAPAKEEKKAAAPAAKK